VTTASAGVSWTDLEGVELTHADEDYYLNHYLADQLDVVGTSKSWRVSRSGTDTLIRNPVRSDTLTLGARIRMPEMITWTRQHPSDHLDLPIDIETNGKSSLVRLFESRILPDTPRFSARYSGNANVVLFNKKYDVPSKSEMFVPNESSWFVVHVTPAYVYLDIIMDRGKSMVSELTCPARTTASWARISRSASIITPCRPQGRCCSCG